MEMLNEHVQKEKLQYAQMMKKAIDQTLLSWRESDAHMLAEDSRRIHIEEKLNSKPFITFSQKGPGRV